LKDTSELLYLAGDQGWVRKDLIATAVGDPVRNAASRPIRTSSALINGITGDARQSTPEIGKIVTDFKVNAAVDQIRQLLATQAAAK
jgi:hypothetical protein